MVVVLVVEKWDYIGFGKFFIRNKSLRLFLDEVVVFEKVEFFRF